MEYTGMQPSRTRSILSLRSKLGVVQRCHLKHVPDISFAHAARASGSGKRLLQLSLPFRNLYSVCLLDRISRVRQSPANQGV